MSNKNDTLQHVTEGSSAANLAHASASAAAIHLAQHSDYSWSWGCSWCSTGEDGLTTGGMAECAAADHERSEHWR